MNISSSIRKPGSYTTIKIGATNRLPSTRQEMVIVGQRLSSGTLAKNIPKAISGPEQAATYWGAGSIMHRMAMAAFKQHPYIIVSGCAVDDAAAGVAATATITFAGAATGVGIASLLIGNDQVSIAISDEMTPAQAATALAAEIAKYPDLPVTATAEAAVVTMTAKNNGTVGNLIGRYNATSEKHEPEITVTAPGLTTTVVGFTGGEGDPADADVSAAYAALASKRYHLYAIAWTSADAAELLSDHLESVSDEINQRPARGYMFLSSALADVTTVSAVNARRLVVGYIRGCRRPSYENAAAEAAMQAASETPWRALNNTELVGCDSPSTQDCLTFNEINNLLWSGVTPFEVGAGSRVRCVRAVSTYTVNDSDAPDSTYLDSFKIATADYVREAIVESHKSNFANSVLRDNHVEGEPEYVVTPADVRSNNLAVCKRIEIAGGLNDVDRYKDLFTAERDPDVPGRVNCSVPIDIVDAAHIFASEIKIVSSF